jgi:DNA-directed RNA polymerase subunit E'/Rpb7
VRVRWLALTPKAGARATGTVSNQGPEHLGLLLLGYFNVTIQASQLRSEYDWDEQEQCWINKKTCATLSIGDNVQFEIIGSSNDSSVLVIFGSIDKMNMKATKEKSSKKSEKKAEPKGWSVSATASEESKEETSKKDKKRKHDGKEMNSKKAKA